MRTNLCRAAYLSAVGLVAAYLLFVPRPSRRPGGGEAWEVKAVTIGNPGWRAYPARPLCRMVRGGRVVFDQRGEAEPAGPVIRLDLTIDGEHVVVFARAAGVSEERWVRGEGAVPPPRPRD